jgi:hypothetical protein
MRHLDNVITKKEQDLKILKGMKKINSGFNLKQICDYEYFEELPINEIFVTVDGRLFKRTERTLAYEYVTDDYKLKEVYLDLKQQYQLKHPYCKLDTLLSEDIVSYDYRVVKYEAEDDQIKLEDILKIAREYNLDMQKLKLFYSEEYFEEDTFYICETNDEELEVHDFADIVGYAVMVNSGTEEDDDRVSEGITTLEIEGHNLIIDNMWDSGNKVVFYDSIFI